MTQDHRQELINLSWRYAVLIGITAHQGVVSKEVAEADRKRWAGLIKKHLQEGLRSLTTMQSHLCRSCPACHTKIALRFFRRNGKFLESEKLCGGHYFHLENTNRPAIAATAINAVPMMSDHHTVFAEFARTCSSRVGSVSQCSHPIHPESGNALSASLTNWAHCKIRKYNALLRRPPQIAKTRGISRIKRYCQLFTNDHCDRTSV
jgi:hypothetical protein